MGALIWLSWALLAPLGPILGHFSSQVAVQLRLWALPWPNKDFPNPIFCAPTANLASFAKPSTCPKHCYLRRFSEVCYLPSSQHVTLNLTLQNQKSKPKSPPRHPKIGPRSPNLAQDDPKMAPKTCGDHLVNPVVICLGTLFWLSWALLAPLGPILGNFRNQVAIQLRLWAPPWPN